MMRDRAVSIGRVTALTAGLALTLAKVTMAEPTLCASADELLQGGELAAARAAYHKLLTKQPRLPCAVQGLQTVRDKRTAAQALVEQADDLEAVGAPPAEVQQARLAALQLDPSRADVRSQIAEALAEPGSAEAKAYAAAERLRVAGYDDAARERAKELSADADEPIPPELSRSPLERGVQWTSKLSTAVTEATTSVVTTLLLVLVALWVLWVLARVLLSWIWVPKRAELVFSEVAGASEDVARALHSRILDELNHAATPAVHMTGVGPPGEPLPTPVALPPQLQFVGPVLEQLRTSLLSQRRCRLICVAYAPRAGQLALSLSIQDVGGRIKDSVDTMAVAEDDYEQLAPLAGAWVVFKLLELQSPNKRPGEIKVLGTTEWRSYGFLRQAQRARSEEKTTLFHRALSFDHANAGALLGLGSEQTKSQDSDVRDQGIRHLELAKQLLDEEYPPIKGLFLPVDKVRSDPLWFTAQYELTIAYLHRFAAKEGKDRQQETKEVEEDLSHGVARATELANAVGATALALRSWPSRWRVPAAKRERLESMLRNDTRFLVAVLAGGYASCEYRMETGLKPKSLKEETAATLDLWDELAKFPKGNLQTASDLFEVFERDPGRGVEGKALVHSGALAHYNRACYLARARRLDESLQALKEALEHSVAPQLQQRLKLANEDPTLLPLHVSQEFMDFIASHAAPAVPPQQVTAPTVEFQLTRY